MTDPLRVHELGRAGGPTLVLLHGFTDSGLCWPDAVRRWSRDYRILAPDARGHGESPRFDPATSGSNRSEEMVADVVKLLEALSSAGGELPILVGHSMGAGIAALVLGTRPDLVRAAVLEDPPWFTRRTEDDGPVERDDVQRGVQTFRDDLDAAVATGRTENPLWPPIEFGPWGVSKTQLDRSLTEPEQIVRPSPWIDDAAAIARPTLLVTGDRDDAVLVGALTRERLAELSSPWIRVEVVAGAGHTVRREATDAYHRIVDRWIREQEKVTSA